jgi:hypothetical protein
MRTSGFACESSEVACAHRSYLRRSSIAFSDAVGHRGADGPVGPVTATVLDQLLELQERVDDGLRARRAAGNVDVDGHDPVDALDRRVAPLIASPGTGAVAQGDTTWAPASGPTT